MFKKPLADLKTSAPLKNSDRKKLRQRVLQEFFNINEPTEVGDLLVPEGLQSVKFMTHGGEQGLAYLSADGEPLWFTIGKGSNELIPTVNTLWKKSRLLPYLSTPSAVISVLQNGADLMAAGVVQMSSNPTPILNQLVSITQYTAGAIGPPLAVGRMSMPGERVREEAVKGKAVKVLHVYKDKLWEMGGRGEPPEPEPGSEPMKEGVDEKGTGEGEDGEGKADTEAHNNEKSEASEEEIQATSPPRSEVGEGEAVEEDAAPPPLTPQEVSTILRTSLIQAICASLSSLPQASFPLPSTLLYTHHVLPARPAYLPSISSSSSDATAATTTTTTPIDIKHSAFKNLTAFLRSAEKDGLLRLKELRSKSGGGDVQILSVNPEHPDVQAHQRYRTIGEVEARRERKEEREREEGKGQRKEMVITELWKPHQMSARLFEESGKDPSALYTTPQIKETLNAYIASKSLVNPHQQQFINVATDDLLRDVLATKGSGGEVPEFMKRDELLRKIVEKMQPWHRIEVDGKDTVLKKGILRPISLSTKLRQGRKACTLITHFEAFHLDADALAEELRRVCASSTSVSPLPGKGAGLEVMVQGKQMKVVRDVLVAKGVPSRWIEESDLTGGKKK